jgi:hypothetical protein
MKYMGSGAIIYIQSFIKIGSGIQKLIGRIHRYNGDGTSVLSFLKNKESRLKIIANFTSHPQYVVG